MLAPAAMKSASGIPDLIPAPGSTATSAPRLFSFLTVSGVAATRSSAGSDSRATAMRILPASFGLTANATTEFMLTGGGQRKRDKREHQHGGAGSPGPGGETVDGDDAR